MNLKKIFNVELAIIIFVSIILVAHFFVQDEYHWSHNTISDMAAQQHPYAWIMRGGFIVFGVMIAISMWLKFAEEKKKNYAHILILIYGVAIVGSGVFSTRPINPDLPYSNVQDIIHSACATVAGIAFSAGIILHLVMVNTPGDRRFHLIYLVGVAICSAGVGLALNDMIPVGPGLVQRLLYLISFIWLYQEYKTNLKVD